VAPLIGPTLSDLAMRKLATELANRESRIDADEKESCREVARRGQHLCEQAQREMLFRSSTQGVFHFFRPRNSPKATAHGLFRGGPHNNSPKRGRALRDLPPQRLRPLLNGAIDQDSSRAPRCHLEKNPRAKLRLAWQGS